MPKLRHPDLLNGSLTAHIIRLSLPMIVAMLFQTGFSVIDMVFLGMVNSEAIAVVSIVFPVIFFFVSFAMGIGAGLTSFIAGALNATKTSASISNRKRPHKCYRRDGMAENATR